MNEGENIDLVLQAKRELLRHMVATVAYRGGLAVSDAPDEFHNFRVHESSRTPGELLAHIGDLLQGSLYLLQGQLVYLSSPPSPWRNEITRFFAAVKELDLYLASGAPLACEVEKLVQGPIGDALTHVGQIVMLRRFAGKPVVADGYFTANIVAGQVSEENFIRPDEQEMSSHLVFIYGTLRRGGDAAMSVRFPRAKFVSGAEVKGTLYDLGPYPGLIFHESGSTITGEVYEVDDRLLSELDDFEASSNYLRKQIEVSIGDQMRTCWTYQPNPETYSLTSVITSGDWINHARSKTDLRGD